MTQTSHSGLHGVHPDQREVLADAEALADFFPKTSVNSAFPFSAVSFMFTS
jgi:hypothetical protein